MDKLKVSAIVLGLLIFGCASIKTGEKMNLFDQTTKAYGRAIRWGDFETAYAFKDLSGTDKEMPDFSEFQQIRITDYKVKQTIISESHSEILRIVAIQYYRMSDVTVKVTKDRQQWEYNEEDERWNLLSELPVFE